MMFEHLKERIAGIQEELGSTAGIEPLSDRWKSGAISAYNDILNIDYNEVDG